MPNFKNYILNDFTSVILYTVNRKKIWWISLKAFALPVILLNVVAGFHAFKFTHFDPSITHKTRNPDQISFSEKIKTLAFGVNNPRPKNKIFPAHSFETISIQSNKRIEGWLIKADSSKGTVIIFHGYSGEKSSMLDKAEVLLGFGYSTFLVDFKTRRKKYNSFWYFYGSGRHYEGSERL